MNFINPLTLYFKHACCDEDLVSKQAVYGHTREMHDKDYKRAALENQRVHLTHIIAVKV